MAALDSNIVTIALPSMSEGLSSGVSLLGWVITAYVLAVAALVLQAGKLGDNYGKKSVYLIGFAVFGAASAMCGLSQTAYQLIGFRVLQGIGASVLAATSLPLVFASFPPSERGAAIGINSVAWAVGAIAGPVLGGILTAVDWRLIFYVNVPVAAAAVLVGTKRIPEWLNERNKLAGKLNLVSSTILGIAIAVTMMWLTFFDVRLIPVAVAAFVLLGVAEAKSRNPLLNRELIRTRGFVFSVIALTVMMVALSGITFVLSFYFQSVAGLSVIEAGVWIAPFPLSLAIFNPVAGRVFDRMKRPAVASIAGGVLTVGALLLLSAAIESQPSFSVIVLMVALGIGQSFVWAPSISSALKFAREELRGVANGTAFTLIYVAFAVSVALVVSISAASLPPALVGEIYLGSVSGLTAAQATLFDRGLSAALVGLAAIASIGVPFLFGVLREQRSFTTYTERPAEGQAPG